MRTRKACLFVYQQINSYDQLSVLISQEQKQKRIYCYISYLLIQKLIHWENDAISVRKSQNYAYWLMLIDHCTEFMTEFITEFYDFQIKIF